MGMILTTYIPLSIYHKRIHKIKPDGRPMTALWYHTHMDYVRGLDNIIVIVYRPVPVPIS